MFELHFTVKTGDRCAACSAGTLSLCGRVPIFGKPGKSRCRFQCNACGLVKTDIQDDRFISSDGERTNRVGEDAAPSPS
jgi:hypothetical protein